MTKKKSSFPIIIDQHPEAEIPVEGVNSRLIQSGDQQFIFMEFEKDVIIPEHSHNAQWGVVFEGEIELTIDGQKNTFRKGDSYFIPKGILHSAIIKKGYKDLTLLIKPIDIRRRIKRSLFQVKKSKYPILAANFG